MSWYNIDSSAVQGAGGWGPGLFDDERKRRRKHYQFAGAPFQAGISPAPSSVGAAPEKFEQMPDYDVQMSPSAAPRFAPAVDLGEGAVQQPAQPAFQDAPRDFRDRAPRPGYAATTSMSATPRGPHMACIYPSNFRRSKYGYIV